MVWANECFLNTKYLTLIIILKTDVHYISLHHPTDAFSLKKINSSFFQE